MPSSTGTLEIRLALVVVPISVETSDEHPQGAITTLVARVLSAAGGAWRARQPLEGQQPSGAPASRANEAVTPSGTTTAFETDI